MQSTPCQTWSASCSPRSDKEVYKNIDPKYSELYRLANQFRKENADIVGDKPRLAGKYRWREFPGVITVLGNTPNFGKVGNTGKYEILELFELKYSAIFP